MTSICFVGLDTYIFNPAIDKGYIGGESVQQSLLTRAFASLEYQVSRVFPDVGQQDVEVIDNIKVRKPAERNLEYRIKIFFIPG